MEGWKIAVQGDEIMVEQAKDIEAEIIKFGEAGKAESRTDQAAVKITPSQKEAIVKIALSKNTSESTVIWSLLMAAMPLVEYTDELLKTSDEVKDMLKAYHEHQAKTKLSDIIKG
jgi:hypothetical protein